MGEPYMFALVVTKTAHTHSDVTSEQFHYQMKHKYL